MSALTYAAYYQYEPMTTTMPKTALTIALIAVLILVVGFGSYLTLRGNQQNPIQSSPSDPCSAPLQNSVTVTDPVSDVWSGPPYPGFQYFLTYNSSDGAVDAIQAEPSCEVSQNLNNCGLAGSNVSMSAASQCLFPPQAGYDILNATSFSDITTVAHHSSAYYVNVQTLQILLRPGWSNCSNPNYGNGTIPCN